MNTYFQRYAHPVRLFPDKPAGTPKISVVIPCFNEPDITTTLNSLQACAPVDGTEVIIIVNEPENCLPEIRQQNLATLEEINAWQQHRQPHFNLLTYHLQAPAKIAGVGYARKVGMDEAARRFAESGNPQGVICCFDADSTCDSNYLQTISRHFYEAEQSVHGAAVYYEHPRPEDPRQAEGIIQYELHLRYYVNALRYIGYPFAHHTIGSTIVVRSDIYQKVGGMNKRQAGEDFYFLHKLMPAGRFIAINTTTIYPAARVSNRVPFGTGKAMGKWQQDKLTAVSTYNLQSFTDLQALFDRAGNFYQLATRDMADVVNQLPASVNAFLQHVSFASQLSRLNRQSTTRETFINNWYRFFDGFMVLRFLHFSRDHYHPNRPVTGEAAALATRIWKTSQAFTGAAMLLQRYRQFDKQQPPTAG